MTRKLFVILTFALSVAAVACEEKPKSAAPAESAHDHKEGDGHDHEKGDGHDHKKGDGDDHKEGDGHDHDRE